MTQSEKDRNSISIPSISLTMQQFSVRHSSSKWDRNHENIIHHVRSQAPIDVRRDSLRSMFVQGDRDGYKCCDYLIYYQPEGIFNCVLGNDESRESKQVDVKRLPSASLSNVNECCRTSICEWMYRVVDYFRVDREVVAIALSYIDRILSTNYCADRRTFKLISSTALYLAIKVHVPHLWEDVGRRLPDLSRGEFVLEDIVSMEKEITDSLTWLLHPSTPQCIAVYLISLLPQRIQYIPICGITNMAIFLIELSICDYYFVAIPKHIVAIGAVLNAIETSQFHLINKQHETGLHIRTILSRLDYQVDWVEVSSTRTRLRNLLLVTANLTKQIMSSQNKG